MFCKRVQEHLHELTDLGACICIAFSFMHVHTCNSSLLGTTVCEATQAYSLHIVNCGVHSKPSGFT